MIIKQNNKIFRSLVSIVFLFLLSKLTEAKTGINYTKYNDIRSTNQFSMGVGTVLTKETYKGIDTKVRVIPFLLYRTEKISLYGPMMNYSLFKDQSYEIGFIAKTRFEGYEENDSRFLQGMDERKWTLELGSYALKKFSFGNINADFSADILNRHRGYELKCYYSYNFRNVFKNPALIITPNFGINYRSDKLNNYYYGVRSLEVIQDRPEYNAGESIGLITGIRINYMYGEKINLMGIISFECLGDEVKNSPIIDNDFGESFILGIMYRF